MLNSENKMNFIKTSKRNSGLEEIVNLFLCSLQKFDDFLKNNQLLQTLLYIQPILDLTEKNQVPITISIPFQDIKNIINSKDPNIALFNYYLKDNNKKLNEVLTESKKYKYLQNKIIYYNDAIKAYESTAYYSACTALFSICDYLLSIISNNNTTNIFKRLDPLKNHLENNESFNLVVCSIIKVLPTFFQHSNFENKSEPIVLNRHWLLHGRSSKIITQYDCIKLFCLIHALLIADILQRQSQEI